MEVEKQEVISVVQERGDGGLGLCSVFVYKKRNHPGKINVM